MGVPFWEKIDLYQDLTALSCCPAMTIFNIDFLIVLKVSVSSIGLCGLPVVSPSHWWESCSLYIRIITWWSMWMAATLSDFHITARDYDWDLYIRNEFLKKKQQHLFSDTVEYLSYLMEDNINIILCLTQHAELKWQSKDLSSHIDSMFYLHSMCHSLCLRSDDDITIDLHNESWYPGNCDTSM